MTCPVMANNPAANITPCEVRCEEAVECDMGRDWSWTREEVHHPPEEGPARTHLLAGVV